MIIPSSALGSGRSEEDAKDSSSRPTVTRRLLSWVIFSLSSFCLPFSRSTKVFPYREERFALQCSSCRRSSSSFRRRRRLRLPVRLLCRCFPLRVMLVRNVLGSGRSCAGAAQSVLAVPALPLGRLRGPSTRDTLSLLHFHRDKIILGITHKTYS